jgi:hypothetical protein
MKSVAHHVCQFMILRTIESEYTREAGQCLRRLSIIATIGVKVEVGHRPGNALRVIREEFVYIRA